MPIYSKQDEDEEETVWTLLERKLLAKGYEV